MPRVFFTVITWIGFTNSIAIAYVADHSNVIENHWVESQPEIRPSLNLGFKATPIPIEPGAEKLQKRVERAAKEKTIEGLYVSLGKKNQFERRMKSFVKLYGKPTHADQLTAWLESRLGQSTPIRNDSPYHKLPLSPEAAEWVDFANLSKKKYGTTHHSLQISSAALRENRPKFRQFLAQVKPYLEKSRRKKLVKRIKANKLIDVEKDLLPSFGRKMSRKYIMHRGPNCFHAALAFQNPSLTKSSFFNVRREEGYHRAMINYDELWRTLSTQFYEVKPAKSELKYGDILVFFDLPKGTASPVDFRWIRHASTWLFDGYVFSKGSKSPNSAYSIKPFDEEWSAWDKYLGNLAVKVFRKHRKSGKSRPSDRLTDWLY